jgi:hypothetical protein
MRTTSLLARTGSFLSTLTVVGSLAVAVGFVLRRASGFSKRARQRSR